MFGIERKKASVINCVIVLVASIPCVLGYNVWSNLHLIGGRDVLDSEDFIVSNNILPLGSLVYLLFCVNRYGWGWDNFIKEADTGNGIKFPKWARGYVTYLLPLIVLYIFVQGYIAKFF